MEPKSSNVYLIPLAIIIAGALVGGGLAFGLSKIGSASVVSPSGATAQTDYAAQLPKVAQALKLNMTQFNECLSKTKYTQRISADSQDAQAAQGQGTPYSIVIDVKGNKVPISGAYPYTNMKLILDAAFKGQPITAAPAKNDITFRAISADDHIQGPANAPVTILEYSDLQCPFCHQFYPTMQQIMKDYSGKVRWVYRHFPLTQIHPYAQIMAEASECASEQGKFWPYIDALLTMS